MLRYDIYDSFDGKFFFVFRDDELCYFLMVNQNRDLAIQIPGNSEWIYLVSDDNFEVEFNKVMDALPILLEEPIMQYLLNPLDNS